MTTPLAGKMIRVDNPADNRPGNVALEHMRKRGGTWAAFQNCNLGHYDLGRLAFLQYGPTCGYPVPPPRYPDCAVIGVGWRYLHVGYVNLTSGEIEETEQPVAAPTGAPDLIRQDVPTQDSAGSRTSPVKAAAARKNELEGRKRSRKDGKR